MKQMISILFLILVNSCGAVNQDVMKVKSLAAYQILQAYDQELVEDVMYKASFSDRKGYYFDRLVTLIQTPTVTSKDIASRARKEIDQSIRKTRQREKRVKELQAFTSREELYEYVADRSWKAYRPNWGSSYFYIVDSNPLDILVHIRIKLNSTYDMIEKILSLEDAVEKHLAIPGFSVNLVFVPTTNDDVFEVDVDPTKWATSHNWSGGYEVIAHELMHLMGLPDEYDKIEVHHKNRHMEMRERLLQFLDQMNHELPLDASQGIMCYHNKKPLQRHVCEAVGLGVECVALRKEEYGKRSIDQSR